MARSFSLVGRGDEVPLRVLPLARELLSFHVRPDLLGHVRWPDGRAAEHRLHGVRASLEVDRVAAEGLALRHRLRHGASLDSLCGAGAAAFLGGITPTCTRAAPAS